MAASLPSLRRQAQDHSELVAAAELPFALRICSTISAVAGTLPEGRAASGWLLTRKSCLVGGGVAQPLKKPKFECPKHQRATSKSQVNVVTVMMPGPGTCNRLRLGGSAAIDNPTNA